MAKIQIKNDRTSQYSISTSDNQIVVEKGVTVDSPNSGINEVPGLTGNEIVVKGTLLSQGMFDAALSLNGMGTEAEIAASGRLKGMNGFIVNGDDISVVNRGRVEGSDFAFSVAGDNAHIVNRGEIIADTGNAFFSNMVTSLRLDNDGLIRSDNGFDFQAQQLELNFGKDSVIELSSTGAIRTNSITGWTATIVNEGKIMHHNVGMSSAISGGAGSENVRNTGTMTGFVDLDAGNDVYDGRGGRVIQGQILGGDGDDTYYISSSKDRVHDSVGWGYDRLTVSASYRLGVNNEMEETRLVGKGDFSLRGNSLDTYLEGNRGDNRILGLAGSDTLNGGAGDDMLIGGTGADAFYFKANSDREIITDFTDGEDLLVLFTGKDIVSVDDLIANHAHQQGADLVISGDGTEMIIRNFDKANLTAADFTT